MNLKIPVGKALRNRRGLLYIICNSIERIPPAPHKEAKKNIYQEVMGVEVGNDPIFPILMGALSLTVIGGILVLIF
jgi:hypothetical protein